jgi:putative phosphoribosyl transferase
MFGATSTGKLRPALRSRLSATVRLTGAAMGRIFIDRRDAGKQLAEAVLRFKGQDPVVLAIPRGGVPIGFEIARALEAPLDLVLVRKIGAPSQPELAMGAVVDGEHPELVLNNEIVEALEPSETFIRKEAARQLREIERRRIAYLGDRSRPPIKGRTAIVVDDGIATGATVRAALIAVRRNGPTRLVLAVPVAPRDTIERLRADVDELICLEIPEEFGAIGEFYADFSQLSDPEVTNLIARADRHERSGRSPAKRKVS